jgi:hypothetical protein
MSGRSRRLAACAATALILASCGGGGGGDGGGNQAPLNIASDTLADGVVGAVYNADLVATGGTGAKTFSLTGSLPDGLTLTSGGSITGTPAGPAGQANFTVNVTDSGSPAETDSQAFTLAIAEPLEADTGSPPTATVGVGYSHSIVLSGGTPPYQVSAALPAGLSIDADGFISGTPTAEARTTDGGGLEVFDSASPRQVLSLPLRIPVTLEVATTALPDATGGVAYSAQLQAHGGLPAFEWDEIGGGLPFFITPSGSISGTADASCTTANYVVDVRVTDSDSPAQTATRTNITLAVEPRAVAIPASSAPPVASVDDPYEHVVSVTPGVAPYAFAVSAGALPTGLSLGAANGRISGTPSAEGTFNFTIEVTDDCGTTDSRAFTIIVRDVPTGRNDSIATATPLGNGSVIASISPSGHPNTQFGPDEDFYRIVTTAASTITVDVSAVVPGTIDTVVELVNAAGNRLQTCGPPQYDDECMNDDRSGGNLDSLLEVEVGAATTFYIHVVEWRGDARPDLRYRLEISGIQ